MRRAVISVALILGISIMIMGCQPVAERKPATPQQQNQTNNMQFQDTNNMADRFERLAEQVPGVRDATVAVSAANQNNAELGVNRINQKLDGDNMTSPGTTNDRTGISQDQRMGNERMPVDQEVPGSAGRTGTSISNNFVVMVGLVFDSKTAASDQREILRMVEEKIKNADSRVSQVLFTTDGGIIKEINSVNDAMRKGTSADNIQRDLDRLTRSLSTNPR
jgi:hypothetical protein